MTKLTRTERAAVEAENDRDIARHRLLLAKYLADAEAQTLEARSWLATLVGSHVYDVELAETAAGADIAAHIDTAERALRAAMAILRGVGE